MSVVVPLAPARVVSVFWDFGTYRIVVERRGQRPERITTRADLESATRKAEAVRRMQRIPSPVVVRPREVLADEADA